MYRPLRRTFAAAIAIHRHAHQGHLTRLHEERVREITHPEQTEAEALVAALCFGALIVTLIVAAVAEIWFS